MTTTVPTESNTGEHWTAETYRLLDAGDPRAWARFAPDIRVQIGNDPVANGAEAAGRAFRPMSEAAPRMRHTVLAVHDVESDRAMLECEVTYHRLDGRTVTLPVVTLVRRDDQDRFRDLRLFFDPSPIFAGQEAHIAMEGSVPVTDDPGLARAAKDAIWDALVDKAHDATKYVPNITECTVVDSGPGWILRDIMLDGAPSQERVTFEPKSRILFRRTRSNMMGTVENFLDESADGALSLRFRFDLRCTALAEGSALAEEIRTEMQEGYNRTFATVGANVMRHARRTQA